LIASDLVKKAEQYSLTDFTYLATCGRGLAGIYVRGDLGVETLDDLRDAGRVRFATSGRGSGSWLFGMLAGDLFGLSVQIVAGYEGTPAYISALLRKDVDAFAIGFESAVIPYIQEGEIKPVLMFLRKPWVLAPDAPTLKGTPYEELEDLAPYRTIAAPPGLPDEVAAVLEKSLLSALEDPELLDWSDKTRHPIFVRDGRETKEDLETCMRLLGKYRASIKSKLLENEDLSP
jgi:tripartite-type tricarboxylate transporter receptor subunit TctC